MCNLDTLMNFYSHFRFLLQVLHIELLLQSSLLAQLSKQTAGTVLPPAIIFFISVLLNLPFMLAMLIFVVFIFLNLKLIKIVCALYFSIKGFSCPAPDLQIRIVPQSFFIGELFQQKIL